MGRGGGHRIAGSSGTPDPCNAKNTCRPDRCFSLLYRTLVFTVMSAL